NAAEIARSEIRTDHPDGSLREDEPGAEAERAPRCSNHGSLDKERGDKLPARGAEHAQQRKVSAPLDHRQRLRGKHQQSTGEQCDERQDIKIDAIGSRHARAGREARLGTLDGETRWESLSQLVAKRGKIYSGPEPQIDARDHA